MSLNCRGRRYTVERRFAQFVELDEHITDALVRTRMLRMRACARAYSYDLARMRTRILVCLGAHAHARVRTCARRARMRARGCAAQLRPGANAAQACERVFPSRVALFNMVRTCASFALARARARCWRLVLARVDGKLPPSPHWR